MRFCCNFESCAAIFTISDCALASLPRWQVMAMLDRLYGKFDQLSKKHGLFKVSEYLFVDQRLQMFGTEYRPQCLWRFIISSDYENDRRFTSELFDSCSQMTGERYLAGSNDQRLGRMCALVEYVAMICAAPRQGPACKFTWIQQGNSNAMFLENYLMPCTNAMGTIVLLYR